MTDGAIRDILMNPAYLGWTYFKMLKCGLFHCADNGQQGNKVRRIVSSFTVESILNLSDLRFYLFDGADRPAVVVQFNGSKPTVAGTRVPYTTPKTDYEVLHAEILTILEQDRTEIRLARGAS